MVSKDHFSLKPLKNWVCFKAQKGCHETPTVAKSPWVVGPCPGDIAGSGAGGVGIPDDFQREGEASAARAGPAHAQGPPLYE